jgi:hypothetical protein
MFDSLLMLIYWQSEALVLAKAIIEEQAIQLNGIDALMSALDDDLNALETDLNEVEADIMDI